MAAPVIETEGLTKSYRGRRGIVDVSLAVGEGEVFGFLGPNGAGKTTTIRTLLDLIRPTRGTARVLGLDSHRDSLEIRRRLGYLPGEVALYPRLTGERFLRHVAALRGGVPEERLRELADRLGCDLTREIRALSHGNRQKVALVQAFMHRPELLLLDEPTQGLDPLVQQVFAELVREARDEGRTVFLSSHVLSEVEALCDRVGIIREGRLIAMEHVRALRSRALRRLEIRFAEPVPEAVFRNLPGVRDLVVADATVRCTVVGALDAVVKAAARFRVEDLRSEEPSLEEVFLTYYREGA